MKTQSYNHTIFKLGKLFIGTESRHAWKGKKLFFVDFGTINILSIKY